MDRFAAILCEKWEKSKTTSGTIRGIWAEDGSEYVIQCPEQLRDLIVELQNRLTHKYELLKRARYEVSRLEKECQI